MSLALLCMAASLFSAPVAAQSLRGWDIGQATADHLQAQQNNTAFIAMQNERPASNNGNTPTTPPSPIDPDTMLYRVISQFAPACPDLGNAPHRMIKGKIVVSRAENGVACTAVAARRANMTSGGIVVMTGGNPAAVEALALSLLRIGMTRGYAVFAPATASPAPAATTTR